MKTMGDRELLQSKVIDYLRFPMIVVVFSPLIYGVIRYLRWFALLLLGGMWILGLGGIVPYLP